MAIWISEIVGLLVILFVLNRYVRPPVRKAMTKQQDLIRQQIEDGKLAEQRLKEAEEAYANAVAEARVDAAKIRDDARADAQAIEEEMRAFAEREVERIKQRGEEQLVLHRQQLTRELRTLVGGQANELAGRIVREHLSDDANRSATVDRFLDELESMSAQGKGEA
jgi:F-type H+-transporting ATPase subunit delta